MNKIVYRIRNWKNKRKDKKLSKRSVELQRKAMEKYRIDIGPNGEMYAKIEKYLGYDDIEEFFEIERYFGAVFEEDDEE